MRIIPEETFLIAADALAAIVTEADLASGGLYPPLNDIQKCSTEIAVKVMEYAYKSSKHFITPYLMENKLVALRKTLLNNYSATITSINRHYERK